MKKLCMFLFLMSISIVLVACGGDTNDTGEEDTTSEDTNEEQEQSETNEEEPEEEVEDTGEAQVGDTITNEAGEMTLVSRTDDVGTFESGPIKLTIDKANGVSGKLSDEMAEMMETEELEYIQVDMTVENTTEENITFYASQAVMTTNTGEQLEPDMWLSDHIDGEYIGQVTKTGTSHYILENSKAEDVESIRLIFSAPSNEDWEDVGEEIDIEIDLEK
ncbi:hypothetical protein [Oceanobacillus halotolerans]|uniref:hypothetical protein n=1 Tax=Oceanobacillus halotolerans TaxID=2663380 RepID=UPI0013DADD0D|nr:hypothetical protein [Oceanobacillus halotolerans]